LEWATRYFLRYGLEHVERVVVEIDGRAARHAEGVRAQDLETRVELGKRRHDHVFERHEAASAGQWQEARQVAWQLDRDELVPLLSRQADVRGQGRPQVAYVGERVHR